MSVDEFRSGARPAYTWRLGVRPAHSLIMVLPETPPSPENDGWRCQALTGAGRFWNRHGGRRALRLPAARAGAVASVTGDHCPAVGVDVAGGYLGVIALMVAAVVAMTLRFGFAILAAVLGLVAVARRMCVLVLRGMWRDCRRLQR